MKIFITLLITLFIVSQAYTQSATEIIIQGKTLHEKAFEGGTLLTKAYQQVIYKCFMNRKQKPYLWCTEFDDRGIVEIQ
ncbi:MAG: hypothetical protein CFH33_01721 [Alphaproteobacteria bacterium MarineAlpha9_Bin3]|nr:MAG: hypothetical protein CFH33_01721 [Alphaproteobacteria bacterium MarineAlpha9_Bin3]|tara:strand:- start:972 stop:1208 length:237 start_codon:yes stop_codon:yes gene_type:complete